MEHADILRRAEQLADALPGTSVRLKDIRPNVISKEYTGLTGDMFIREYENRSQIVVLTLPF